MADSAMQSYRVAVIVALCFANTFPHCVTSNLQDSRLAGTGKVFLSGCFSEKIFISKKVEKEASIGGLTVETGISRNIDVLIRFGQVNNAYYLFRDVFFVSAGIKIPVLKNIVSFTIPAGYFSCRKDQYYTRVVFYPTVNASWPMGRNVRIGGFGAISLFSAKEGPVIQGGINAVYGQKIDQWGIRAEISAAARPFFPVIYGMISAGFYCRVLK